MALSLRRAPLLPSRGAAGWGGARQAAWQVRSSHPTNTNQNQEQEGVLQAPAARTASLISFDSSGLLPVRARGDERDAHFFCHTRAFQTATYHP